MPETPWQEAAPRGTSPNPWAPAPGWLPCALQAIPQASTLAARLVSYYVGAGPEVTEVVKDTCRCATCVLLSPPFSVSPSAVEQRAA